MLYPPSAWQSLHRRLLRKTLVLAAHRDPLVQQFLIKELRGRGIEIRGAKLSERDSRVRTGDYAVIITDADIDWQNPPETCDWFVVERDSPAATQCLARGASDATTKLRTQKHALLRRIHDVVSARATHGVFDALVAELRSDLTDLSAEALDGLERGLQAGRVLLDERPAAAFCCPRPEDADALAQAVTNRAQLDCIPTFPGELLDTLESFRPLVVVLRADLAGSTDLTNELAVHGARPELLVVANRGPERHPGLLWSDWAIFGEESIDVIAARTRLLWARARRRHLYDQLVSALSDARESRLPSAPYSQRESRDSHIAPGESREAFSVAGSIGRLGTG